MSVRKGNGTGTISLAPYNIPYTIKSFSITNVSGSPITVNVYIVDGAEEVLITAKDYSLKDGQAYVRELPTFVNPNNYIKITTTGTIDYYFSIE